MKIGKKIKDLPWPPLPKGLSDLQSYAVTVQEFVIEHKKVTCVTFINNPKSCSYSRRTVNVRIVIAKRDRDYTILTSDGQRTMDTTKFFGTSFLYMYPYISEADEAKLRRITGKDTQNHQLDNLCRWLNDAREYQREQKAIKSGRILDGEYELCPEQLPEGFTQWVRRQVINYDNTLIYKKGNVRGTCSVCGRDVRATGRRFIQYQTVRCPDCGAEVLCVLKDSNTWKNDYVDNVAAAQLGTDGKTVFFRIWHVVRDFSNTYEPTEKYLQEVARYAIRGDKAAMWVKEHKYRAFIGRCYTERLSRWERSGRIYIYDGQYTFCQNGLEEIIQNTSLRYKQPLYYEERTEWPNIIKYCIDAARYPLMEFLIKNDFFMLIEEKIYGGIGIEESKYIKFCKKSLKQAFTFNPRYLKLLKPEETRARDIKRLGDALRIKGITEDDIREIMSNDLYRISAIEKAAKYKKPHSIITYLKKQNQKTKDNGVCDLYNDYLRECEELHLDLNDKNIIFPSDLVQRHIETAQMCAKQKSKIDKEKFTNAVKKYESYSFAYGTLEIVPVKTPGELSREGAALHHCVGSYAERVKRGDTMIFFIRKKSEPKKPYFTLELYKGNIQQCRTKNNRSYTEVPEVEQFINMWMQFIRKKDKKCKKSA